MKISIQSHFPTSKKSHLNKWLSEHECIDRLMQDLEAHWNPSAIARGEIKVSVTQELSHLLIIIFPN